MKAPTACTTSTSALPQRVAGAVLVLIAFVLIVFDAAGVLMTPKACSVLLLITLAIIAFAVYKSPRGVTSLIGLFFLTTLVFILPRPLFALVTQDDSIYTLLFGQLVQPRGPDLIRLLAFWIVGIAAMFGGYFLFLRRVPQSLRPLSGRDRICCKQTFVVAFIGVCILLPIVAHNKLEAFFSGGYTSLYLNQAQYSFDVTRPIEFLVPLLFALAVIINEKSHNRMMFVAVVSYVLVGAVVGQRKEIGSWLLVALWYLSTVRRNRISFARLFTCLIVTVLLFQWIEMLREGGEYSPDHSLLIQFFVGQGIIFMLPALSWQLPPPPVHSIVGSILPMGALFHLLGVGSAGTTGIGVYVTSQSSPTLFETGYGLDSSAYMEVFYICGQVWVLYAAVCGLLGFLLRKWEERASRSRVALFFLCVCLSSLFAIQRMSMNTLSSKIIYLSVFMTVSYLLSFAFSICRPNRFQTEVMNGTN